MAGGAVIGAVVGDAADKAQQRKAERYDAIAVETTETGITVETTETAIPRMTAGLMAIQTMTPQVISTLRMAVRRDTV